MGRRKSVKPEKVREVEELSNMIDKYPIAGILNLYKIPASALQKIKRELYGKAVIKVIRKSILLFALEKSRKKELKNYITLNSGLLLTEMDPFKLQKFLLKNKSESSAKPGDIVTKEIEVKAGPTDIPPGPAISTLTKVGIPAKVEGGKIAVMKDKLVCKAGETVSMDLATALNLLKIKPMEIMMNLEAVWEKGLIYTKDALKIDEEKVLSDVLLAYQHAVNLSVNTGYTTKETIRFMIIKAFLNAKQLGTETNMIDKGIIKELITKAKVQAEIIKEKSGV